MLQETKLNDTELTTMLSHTVEQLLNTFDELTFILEADQAEDKRRSRLKMIEACWKLWRDNIRVIHGC